jgi:hypothetical protein
MNTFHDHLSRQLADKLLRRRIVVWYDEHEEFVDFIEELSAGAVTENAMHPVRVGEVDATLARLRDAVISLRLDLESRVAKDWPDPLLVYLPGEARPPKFSMLMEMEKAGECIGTTSAWRLKGQARTCLAKHYTDGKIDELLKTEALSYADVQAMLKHGDGVHGVSPLKLLYPDMKFADLLAAWIVDPAADGNVLSRGAFDELVTLITSRAGLVVQGSAGLDELRERLVRHVLLAEFRGDLGGAAPAALATIPMPNGDALHHCHEIALAMRTWHASAYEALADQVQAALNLPHLSISAEHLGKIDTFRFEEELLLGHAVSLASAGKFDAAKQVVDERRRSFWLDRDVHRQSQWQAATLVCDLGALSRRVRSEVAKTNGSAASLVGRYADEWHALDRLHRETEAWIANMDEEPACEPALHVVRAALEETLEAMARAFTSALGASHWSVPGVLHQTRIHPDVVATRGGPVAWFWVDAMRFEMGAELRDLLREALDLVLVPAVAALPSITPVGMAALLPGSASGFTVVEHADGIVGAVEGAPLGSSADRMQYLRGRVPGAKDLRLGQVLDATQGNLRNEVEGTPLLVIRSQEIDESGEGGTAGARALFGAVVHNLARAVRKLASAGIEHFVITADHGHQFLRRKESDACIDKPGTAEVDLHRRVWVGRGGKTPIACVRLRAGDLGYDGDLEYVFPQGLGVFKAGGDLTFHHGAASLQELIIPVLSFRMAAKGKPAASAATLKFISEPKTQREPVFALQLTASGLFGATVRVVLMNGDTFVGDAGRAMGGQWDDAAKTVKIDTGGTVYLLMSVQDAGATKARALAIDAATGATLATSEEILLQVTVKR